MIEIKEIHASSEKAVACNNILRALPTWFGIEESIVDYVKQVQQMPFYAAYAQNEMVGFVTIKNHNEYTAEVCVMGVLEEYHGQGIGKKLIESCEDYCIANGKQFLTVKTVDASANYESYKNTLRFYLKMGFIPLEVFPQLWDESNPCLFLVKYLGQ